jgi:DNA-binding LytR/AlgR family response regulator
MSYPRYVSKYSRVLRMAEVPVGHLEDITHVVSERNYVRVYLRDGSEKRVRGVLGQWQRLLSAAHFARISRSIIVNVSAVKRVQRIARDVSLLELSGARRPVRLGRKASVQLLLLLVM